MVLLNYNNKKSFREMDYFKFQKDIDEDYRAEFVNWIIDRHWNYKLKLRTFFLGITLFDKYLSVTYINNDELFPIGATCLFISAKIEEVYSLDINDIFYLLEKEYSSEEILELESKILTALNFKIYHPTIAEHLKIMIKKKKLNSININFCTFLAMATQLTIDYMFIDPIELVEKIIEFVTNFQNIYSFTQEFVNSDPIYAFLFKCWYDLKKSGYDSLINKYNLAKYSCISKIKIPKFKLINYQSPKNIMAPSNIVHETDKKISIYSRESIAVRINIEQIGSGTYGKVKKVIINGKMIAMKKAIKNDDNDGIQFHILREINALCILSHENIICMDGCYHDWMTESTYIGLELMDKDLHSVNFSTVEESIKFSYILQLLSAVKYMHDNNIMHRDISAKNILIKNDVLKLSDLGSSKYFVDDKYDSLLTMTICTLNVRAIELLLGQNPYTHKIDIWSCACIICHILDGKTPFTGNDEKEIIMHIFKKLGTPTTGFGENLCQLPEFNAKYPIYKNKTLGNIDMIYPNQCKILHKMLNYDPEKRLSAKESLQQFTYL